MLCYIIFISFLFCIIVLFKFSIIIIVINLTVGSIYVFKLFFFPGRVVERIILQINLVTGGVGAIVFINIKTNTNINTILILLFITLNKISNETWILTTKKSNS